MSALHSLWEGIMLAFIMFVLLWPPACAGLPDTPPTQDRTLTLAEAMQRVGTHNPARAAALAARDAAGAAVRQQELRPNPLIDLEVENFAGGGDLSGLDGAETTVTITQDLQINGERGRRVAVAREALVAATADSEALQTRLTESVLRAYTAALIAQSRIGVRAELLQTASEVAAAVELRVSAGKVPPLEAERARIGVVQARLALADAVAERDTAFRALAAHWGASIVDFDHLAGDISAPPSPDTLLPAADHLGSTPALRSLEAGERGRRAEIDLELALSAPDLAVTGGIRRLHDLGETAFTAGLSIELPLFDRNQGAIAAAEARTREASFLLAAARNEIRSRFDIAMRDVRRGHERLALARSEILPAADRLLRDMRIGYEAGKFSYLELLDAQRIMIEAREQELDLLAACHAAAIEALAAAAFPADQRLPQSETYFSGANHE
jgi:cobalt-zinc-cadmium efflux system outer membrane protein